MTGGPTALEIALSKETDRLADALAGAWVLSMTFGCTQHVVIMNTLHVNKTLVILNTLSL